MIITFVGGGNMATALIKGLVDHPGLAREVRVSDPSEAARSRLGTEPGVRCFASATEAIPGSDVIVLAVKPQVMPAVLAEISGLPEPGTLVVSVAAGTTISTLKQALGNSTPVVRTMPNTPALLGAGATGLYAAPDCTANQRDLAEAIMNAVGDTVWVENEALIDVVTAVSGSGPAYFYLLTEALADAGAELGLPAEVARQLAVATAHGAGLMATQGDVDVAELRRRVTSPGGTTQAALESFEAEGFRDLVRNAAAAAVRRGRELSGGDA